VILLHIGGPATGARALQRVLGANEAALRARGISLMRTAREGSGHDPLAREVGRGAGAPLFEAIRAEHDAAPDLLHVISSSAFLRPIVVTRLGAAIPGALRDKIRVLVCLARADHHLEALYKLRVQQGLVPPDRAAFVTAHLSNLRHLPVLDAVADILGRDAIGLRPCKRGNPGGGDFLRDVATDFGHGSFDGLPTTPEALPLSVELCEMLGRCAVAAPERQSVLIDLVSASAEPDIFAAQDSFDLSERRRIVAETESDSAAVCARFRPDLRHLFDVSDLEAGIETPARAPATIARRAEAGARALARALSLMHALQDAAPNQPAPAAASAPDPPPPKDAGAAYPLWFSEICPAGPRQGFFVWLGNHGASFVDRGSHQLVVTFDNLHNVGDTRRERNPWAAHFCAERGWSHLGVISQRPDWFRDAALIGWFEARAAEGFFARFARVAFAGASMGGFGALVFSTLAPGATVMAFSPQSTLARRLVRWERRFAKGRAADWTLPRGDAAEAIGSADRVWVVVDPFQTGDMRHAARLGAGPVKVLRAPGCGHKTALALNRMGVLKEVLGGAIDGTLDPGDFAGLVRGRRELMLWYRELSVRLEARGQTARAERLRRLFRAHRNAAGRGGAPAAPPSTAEAEDFPDAD
jgi:hypothetical protein